ncbi:MAG: trigger factor [Brevinema sp.]
MYFHLKQYPDGLRQLFVSVTPAETNTIFDLAVLQIQKTFAMPGYRKGKVPTDIIVKTNPPELMNVVSDICRNKALDYLYEQKTSFYGQPRFNPMKGLSRDKEFTFSLVYEVYPIITKSPDLNIDVRYQHCELDQEFLEDSLCRQIGLIETVTDTIKDTDLVQVSVLNDDYHGDKKEAAFDASKLEVLVGKKIGDKIEISFDDLSGYLPEFLGTVSSPLKIEITEISRPKSWEKVTDEEIAERTPFKTKDEYLQTSKTQLEEIALSYNNSQKALAVTHAIGSQIEVEIPKSLWLNNLRDLAMKIAEQDIIREDIALKSINHHTELMDKFKNLPLDAQNGVALVIWLDEFAKQENISIDDKEIEYSFYRYAQKQQMTLDQFKKHLTPEDKENIKIELLREKAMSLLITKLTFKISSTIYLSEILKKNR